MKLMISVVGFGNIGKFISGLLLTNTEHHFHINIIDKDWHVYGAILDMEHGIELYPNHEISYNNEEHLNNSDFIFHCAGASVPRGKSRLITCQTSIEITEAIFKNYRPKKEPFIIVVANPVEIITFITQRITGLPRQNIIGTGTFLDSIRMNHAIKKTNNNISSVNAILLGEHGTSVFLSEQFSRVNGVPFNKVFDKDTLNELLILVKASAEEIKETQKATIYGVSYCAIHVFESLLSKKIRQIPVSTFIPQYLSINLNSALISLSLYSEISELGAYPIETYIPNKDELEYLKKSVDLITPCIPKNYL